MIHPPLLTARLYRLLLACYPPGFRAEFGAEMQAVFNQVAADACSRGPAALFAAYLRELCGLVAGLLRQHLESIRWEDYTMAPGSDGRDNPKAPFTADERPGSWGAAFLAGLPLLLVGLLFGAGRIAGPAAPRPSQATIVVGVSFLALLVALVLAVAWRRRWPRWSASWYGYGAWLWLALPAYLVSRLDLPGSWRYFNALFLGWLALWAAGYLYLFFRDRLAALLSIFALIPLVGVTMLEFVPGPVEGWLAVGLGLLTALAAAIMVRLGTFRAALGLAIGVDLMACLALAYVDEYQMLELPRSIPAHTPAFASFLAHLAFYGAIALVLLAGPFLLQSLVRLGRRKPLGSG
jgi:hypothetical protein